MLQNTRGEQWGLCLCRGRYHAVNVPLKDGMTDEAYEQVFQPVMRRVVEIYQPEVVVFQSGARCAQTFCAAACFARSACG